MAGEPIHLDDATLLDWIEGELSPQRHRLVTKSLSEQPALQARVDAMRLDRFTLASIGDEKAPAGLLDGVADLLEREMLVSGFESQWHDDQHAEELPESVEATPVVATIGPQRQASNLQLAMAAGLLLVVGAGAWFGGMMFAGGKNAVPDTTGPGPIAQNPPAQIPGATELANQQDASADTDHTVGVEEPSAPPLVIASSEPRMTDAFSEITPERAVELLQAGRLIVRVRMADLSGLTWIDGVETLRGVNIERELPEALAKALEPEDDAEWRDIREPAYLAMDDAPLIGPPIDIELPPVPKRLVAERIRVEMKMDPATLASALRGLKSQDGIVDAYFEDAGEPLPHQLERPNFEQILWWRQPPEQWTPRAMVPVVFEVLQ